MSWQQDKNVTLKVAYETELREDAVPSRPLQSLGSSLKKQASVCFCFRLCNPTDHTVQNSEVLNCKIHNTQVRCDTDGKQ